VTVSQGRRIRVLIADDSALMRQTLRQVIESDPELELIGVARDGEDAVIKSRELRPDVLSLDINMPKLDGISALQIVNSEQICPVVMVSSLTQKGAVATLESLELGAFDFVAKPDGTVSSNLASVGAEIRIKLKAAAASGTLHRLKRPPSRARTARREPAPALEAKAVERAVAIGISTGGPATLMDVLPRIQADAPAPFFLVQHMPPLFIHTFAQRLDEACAIEVVEAEAGMITRPGVCYVAPGDRQLTLFRKSDGSVVVRTPSQPETLFMPSVDVMMKSVLSVYGAGTIGVLMTGIGDDGAQQMVEITKAGGYTIAESQESCIVYGMPRQAIETGGAKVAVPSWDIADEITLALKGGRR